MSHAVIGYYIGENISGDQRVYIPSSSSFKIKVDSPISAGELLRPCPCCEEISGPSHECLEGVWP